MRGLILKGSFVHLAKALLIGSLAVALVACESRTTGRYRPGGESAAEKLKEPLAEEPGNASQSGFVSQPVDVTGTEEDGGSGLRGPEVYFGNDRFAAPTAALGPSALEGGRVTLNFAGADIREVANVILGDTLNLSYVIDPAVQGTVTVRTSQPLARSAVIPALENILALNNAALVFADGIYKIVPLDAAAGNISTPVVQPSARTTSAGYGINIIPLRFASAGALLDVLSPFIGPGRTLRVDETRNLLIYVGSGTEAKDLTEMVKIFDVDWMAGMSFGLFPIEIAEPEVMIQELQQIFAQGAPGGTDGVLRFIPVERLNAILAISPRSAYLERVRMWIDRLDRGAETLGRRIFVYNVQNGRAVDLAEILNQVFDSGGSGDGRSDPRPSVAPGLSAVDIEPERDVRRRDRTRSDDGGDEAQGDSESQATRRQAAQGNGTSRTSLTRFQPVQQVSDSGGSVANLIEGGSDIRIIADERNNSLVVLATPVEYRMIEATLRRLDVIPLQVLIEVTIADVTLNDDLRYGLQWFFTDKENNSATFSSLLSGEVASVFPGFSYVLNASNARVVLNALTQITDVTVISSPSVMVLDNQSARLQVGDEVPIATQSSVSVVDPDSPIVNAIQFRDTGVILEVTPRVNAGGLVELEVLQEVSNVVATTSSTIDSPTIQTRSIESVVAVQSGESIALGGLIQDEKEDGTTGIPILSQVPIVGNLFKTTVDDYFRRELLVLITPQRRAKSARSQRGHGRAAPPVAVASTDRTNHSIVAAEH